VLHFESHPPQLFQSDRLWTRAIGSGVPSGYTSRWSAADITWSVQAETAAGPPSDKEIKATITVQHPFIISMNSFAQLFGTAADVDVVGLVMAAAATGGNNHGGIGARILGASGSEEGYVVTLRSTADVGTGFRLIKYSAGAITTVNTYTYAWTAATWYFMRLRCTGTTIQGRIWTPGSAEPATWHINVTDSTVTAAGRVGLYAFSAAGSPSFGYIAATPTGPAPLF
jgi:hypothetical protein